MQPSRKDILGTQNPERRLKVILEHVKKPDGLAFVDLLHELKLSSNDRSGIKRNHLEPLVKSGILKECYVVSEYGKRGKKRPVDGYRVCGDLPTLWKVLVAAGRDRRTRQTVQNSQYVSGWHQKLVDALNRSFAELGLTKIDIEHVGCDPKIVENLKKNTTDGLLMHHHREHIKHLKHLIESGELDDNVVAGCKKELASRLDYNPDPPYTFSDSELKDITKALECNWTMLYFIVRYLSADNESKRGLMLKLATDTNLGTASGATVAATGWMAHYVKKFSYNGVVLSGVVPDECQHFLDIGVDRTITDSMLRYATTKTIEQLLGRDPNELQTMWFSEWFRKLDKIRDRYPFLFD